MIRIALYKGKSLISKAIQWQTRSQYSHAAALLDDDSVIEAWHIGGVSHVENMMVNHSLNTPIDIFIIPAAKEQQKIYEKFLLDQVGKQYDFRSVFRFLDRIPAAKNDKWFCSELVIAALYAARIKPLYRIIPAEVSPKLLSISPILKNSRLNNE